MNIKRKWRVESNTTKGKFYDVIMDRSGKFHCSCVAGQMNRVCSHIKKIKKEIRDEKG